MKVLTEVLPPKQLTEMKITLINHGPALDAFFLIEGEELSEGVAEAMGRYMVLMPKTQKHTVKTLKNHKPGSILLMGFSHTFVRGMVKLYNGNRLYKEIGIRFPVERITELGTGNVVLPTTTLGAPRHSGPI